MAYLNNKQQRLLTETKATLEDDHGIFVINKCSADQQGITYLKDYLLHYDYREMKLEDFAFNQSMRPTCISINKTPFQTLITPDSATTGDSFHEEIGLVLGTTDGSVLMFDPVIRGKMEIKSYNYDCDKKTQKSVDLVKWMEKCPNRASSSRFIVIFSDGTTGLYHKDRIVPQTGTNGQGSYDPDKDMIKIGSEAPVSRLQVSKRMKGFVQDYNYDECYTAKASKKGAQQKSKVVKQSYQQELGMIKMKENVMSERQLNYVASYVEPISPTAIPEVNPYYLMRYDCRQINDVISFWPT